MRLCLVLPTHQDCCLFRRRASSFEDGCGQVLAVGIAPQGVERPRHGLLYVRQTQFFRACFEDAAQEQVCDVAEI